MNAINLNLPDSLHQRIKEFVDKDRITIDQFIISAITEKLAAFMTKDYLEERAKRGSKKKFDRAMAKAPDVEPEDYDRL